MGNQWKIAEIKATPHQGAFRVKTEYILVDTEYGIIARNEDMGIKRFSSRDSARATRSLLNRDIRMWW